MLFGTHNPNEITLEKAEELVPVSIYNFLVWLVCGELNLLATDSESKEEVCLKRHQLVFSLAQDLIYAVTDALVKPPKQVALSSAIHHLSGSKQLVQMINGFGHGIPHPN